MLQQDFKVIILVGANHASGQVRVELERQYMTFDIRIERPSVIG